MEIYHTYYPQGMTLIDQPLARYIPVVTNSWGLTNQFIVCTFHLIYGSKQPSMQSVLPFQLPSLMP